MRILLVSQMYPGPEDPDLGVFVAQLERELLRRGHEIERAVLDRRSGGKRRFLTLLREARKKARRFHPDVIYAHFLVPSGLIGALAGKAPLVVTAHGQDVRNIGTSPSLRRLTGWTVKRASAVIAVSGFLAIELETQLREARGKVEVIDCGVDVERFRPGDQSAARAVLGWDGKAPLFLCAGSLTARKNVVRLARAFERLGKGSLVFIGDGPLRAELEGLAGVSVLGRVPHERVPVWLAACDVLCQPSLIEPFGQALLEAMACGRTVVATRIGGPPEFVPVGAGLLVDPLDEDALVRALGDAARLPCPNEAGRAAAAGHSVELQAERIEQLLLRAAGSA
ncbi:MAG: glycosyltransferase [Gaiellaceae bacterium]|jgi:glycosyltransferase involved in cell wall biosynthesis